MITDSTKPVLTPNGEVAVIEPAPPFDPRKLVRNAKAIFLTILKYWWLLGLCIILGGVGGWIYDQVNEVPDQYEASIVFNLETGSGGSELSSFASALGMSSGGSNGNIFAGANFTELFRSKKIGNRVMTTPVTIAGKRDLLVNFYKNRSGALRRTKNAEYLRNEFTFPDTSLKYYTTTQMSYLDMFREYASQDLEIGNLDRKSSFMELTVKTDSDTLSKIMVETWLKTMTSFYTETRSQKTLELLQLHTSRRDSVLSILSGEERKLARAQDYSQYMIMPSGRVNEQRMSQNTTYLQGLYMDALRNIDALRTSLIRESPLVTIIDEPTYPLPVTPYPRGKAIKIGIALGIVLSFVMMFLITTYQNMMKKLQE
ncbi:hypothetical protein [Siphonobacter sp. SORGH_AS_0500]|uniref:hypothetical protein n=1 Tax=Siphonobacter sp. SORGH_AS_0500 TaxID=1864824 RepID=UPI00286789B7|nr:hypothetical protein [Siphonobacter sp. SORGH_AS_0500]MDR6194882.1 hypothetical protein [Siphonobacter sp. SORGH_AS_0500]